MRWPSWARTDRRSGRRCSPGSPRPPPTPPTRDADARSPRGRRPGPAAVTTLPRLALAASSTRRRPGPRRGAARAHPEVVPSRGHARLHARALGRRQRVVARSSPATSSAPRRTCATTGPSPPPWASPMYALVRAAVDGRPGLCAGRAGGRRHRAGPGRGARRAGGQRQRPGPRHQPPVGGGRRAGRRGRHAGARRTATTLDESMGPWVPIGRAFMHAVCGEVSAARAELDVASSRLPELPLDSEWLPAVTQAAEAVQLVGGPPGGPLAPRRLLPHADLCVVEGIGAMLRGSVHRHLGGLAALLGDRAAAEAPLRAGARGEPPDGGPAARRADPRPTRRRPSGTRPARQGEALYAEMGVTGRLGRGCGRRGRIGPGGRQRVPLGRGDVAARLRGHRTRHATARGCATSRCCSPPGPAGAGGGAGRGAGVRRR